MSYAEDAGDVLAYLRDEADQFTLAAMVRQIADLHEPDDTLGPVTLAVLRAAADKLEAL